MKYQTRQRDRLIAVEQLIYFNETPQASYMTSFQLVNVIYFYILAYVDYFVQHYFTRRHLSVIPETTLRRSQFQLQQLKDHFELVLLNIDGWRYTLLQLTQSVRRPTLIVGHTPHETYKCPAHGVSDNKIRINSSKVCFYK